jgi:hypothetical protein
MGKIVQFPSTKEHVELAQLKRAYDAELERREEQEMPLPDKRVREAAQAYFKALARVDGPRHSTIEGAPRTIGDQRARELRIAASEAEGDWEAADYMRTNEPPKVRLPA